MHCLWFLMLDSKSSQNLNVASWYIYFQLVFFAVLTRAPYWWHEASSQILAKRCHFWGWHSHVLQNYNLPPTNSAQYLNSCRVLSWSLLFPGWRDYSWVIQEIIDENKKCWEQRKKKKKENLLVRNIMGEEQCLSGSLSTWVRKCCIFWIHSTLQESLKTKELCILLI